MANLLEVKGLCKHYDDFALQDVSFSLPGGAIMGFVGENGAGKTTTMKAILNLIRPDAGSVTILGGSMAANETLLKSQLGVVFDESYFHDNLTVENVDHMMCRIYKNWDSAYFKALCDRFSLPAHKIIKAFSRGMKTKLSIAAALAHRPKLLLLDEATSGLDPIVRDEILDVFLDFIRDEEHSILFSSHITSDLEKIADYVTFIHKGRVLFSENKDTLIYQYGVAKCTAATAALIDPREVLAARTSAMGREFLVKDKDAFAHRHPGVMMDTVTLEEIMLFYVKGDRR